jgi:hypothetical protein
MFTPFPICISYYSLGLSSGKGAKTESPSSLWVGCNASFSLAVSLLTSLTQIIQHAMTYSELEVAMTLFTILELGNWKINHLCPT